MLLRPAIQQSLGRTRSNSATCEQVVPSRSLLVGGGAFPPPPLGGASFSSSLGMAVPFGPPLFEWRRFPSSALLGGGAFSLFFLRGGTLHPPSFERCCFLDSLGSKALSLAERVPQELFQLKCLVHALPADLRVVCRAAFHVVRVCAK